MYRHPSTRRQEFDVSGFRVVTEQLAGQAVSLDGLGGKLDGAGSLIAQAGAAAADTPAAGALTAATAAWVQVLEQYAEATHGLATAVALAAECYAVTDGSAVPDG
jgi:hypothetical protein